LAGFSAAKLAAARQVLNNHYFLIASVFCESQEIEISSSGAGARHPTFDNKKYEFPNAQASILSHKGARDLVYL
jgi:hypothetical protein